MERKKVRFHSIDEYIGSFPKDVQKIMKQLRATIKAAAPDVEEKISYQMPTFNLNGKYLVYFAAWKNHIAMYPIPSGNEAFNKEVSKYVVGKGTLKFPLDKPLPLKLITKIVKSRVAENLKRTDKREYLVVQMED